MRLFGNILKGIGFLFFSWLFFYFGMPATSFNFSDIIVAIFGVSLIGIVLFLPFRYLADEYSAPKSNIRWLGTGISGAVCVFSLLVLIIVGLSSTPFFREGWYEPKPNSFQALLGKINDSCDISSDVSPIDPNHIVVMDEANALRLAEKRLTEYDKSLGSQTRLGEPHLMKIDMPNNSFMAYVVPIEHDGFWKWFYNKTTPGYILVNAQNDRDVRMITEINGVKLTMKFIESSCFSTSLTRHVYMNGYSDLGITDITLEADDNLYPYYVMTTYENTIGYAGENATGVLVVDPVSGDIKKYSIEDAPKWIDRIQPIDFVGSQIYFWGKYIHGMWANWSGKDQLAPTSGSTVVYGNDSICYIYVGVTSVGSDDASAGFFLVNSRNKEARYYRMTGATEQAAQKAAAGAIPEKAYEVTLPRPYNIDGTFTYVMAHKDSEGLIKQISFVSYANYEIVGIGQSMQTALSDYKKKLREKNVYSTTKSKGLYDITGIVDRFTITNENCYFTIQNFDRIFVAPNNLSEKLFVTQKSDKIKIKFENRTGVEIYVDYFDNLDVKTDSTFTSIEKYYQTFDDSLNNDKYAKDYDARYKKMSDTEKYDAKGMRTNTSQNPDEVKLSKKEKATKENEYRKK